MRAKQKPTLSPRHLNRDRSAAIDLNHLSRYSYGDRDLELELLSMFQSRMQDYLVQLEELDNAKLWRDIAHTIKGSARAIGAWRIADVAEQLETLGNPSAPSSKSLLKSLKTANNEIDEFIAEFLGSHADA